MGLNVDGISLMPAAAHSETVCQYLAKYLVRSGGLRDNGGNRVGSAEK